jgi:hypothetical protein
MDVATVLNCLRAEEVEAKVSGALCPSGPGHDDCRVE